MDIFGLFCSSTVKDCGGLFNSSFWQVEVPRAAAVYPSMWHAGIALAAINQSVKQTSPQPTTDPWRKSHYYQEALTHFNKSIQHLSKALQERGGKLSYMDKEMVLMTNLLYYGIANMLNDPSQVIMLHKSFNSLLEQLRFGDDDPSQCRGIMGYKELLALILCVDACAGCNEALPSRSARSWTVSVPAYQSYQTVTEAYISLLPIVHWNMQGEEEAKLARNAGKAASAIRLAQIRRFERRLADLLASLPSPTNEDREAIEYMQHFASVHKIREQSTSKASRLDVIMGEEKLIPILDYLDRSLTESSSTDSCSPVLHSPPLRYSHYSGYLLERIVGWAHSVEIRRRGIALMRKWPYREGDKYSYQSSFFYETVVQHDLAGPDRTRALQLAGNPIIPSYRNGELVDRLFDPLRECECVRGVYVCSDHKLGSLRMQMKFKPRYFALASRYEARHNIGYTRYYLDEVGDEGKVDYEEHEIEYKTLDYVG